LKRDLRTVDEMLVEAERPELKPGHTWGDPITFNEIKVGDIFKTVGSRRVSSQSGKIIKVSRVNLEYATTYFGKPMALKTRKDELAGGYVQRGKVMHEVVHP